MVINLHLRFGSSKYKITEIWPGFYGKLLDCGARILTQLARAMVVKAAFGSFLNGGGNANSYSALLTKPAFLSSCLFLIDSVFWCCEFVWWLNTARRCIGYTSTRRLSLLFFCWNLALVSLYSLQSWESSFLAVYSAQSAVFFIEEAVRTYI